MQSFISVNVEVYCTKTKSSVLSQPPIGLIINIANKRATNESWEVPPLHPLHPCLHGTIFRASWYTHSSQRNEISRIIHFKARETIKVELKNRICDKKLARDKLSLMAKGFVGNFVNFSAIKRQFSLSIAELRLETTDGDLFCVLVGRSAVCLPALPDRENRSRQAVWR